MSFQKKFFIPLLLSFYLPSHALDSPAASQIHQASQAETAYAPNMVYVKFQDSLAGLARTSPLSAPQFSNLFSDLGVSQLAPLLPPGQSLHKTAAANKLRNVYIVHYKGSQSPVEVAKKLAAQQGVEYAEPCPVRYPCAVPNDSLYGEQYYLQNIKAPAAWDVVKAEGHDVIIAIVDTGTDIDHPDLAANVWVNEDEIAGNGLDDDGNGYIDDVHGWNFSDNTPDPRSAIGAAHGTMTAGIACAVTDNGQGIAGTSWNAKLLPVNAAMQNNAKDIAYGFQGILYAAENGAHIINCSWGSPGSSITEQLVIDFVSELGAVVIAAAGNDSSSSPFYPGSYNHVYSVAAIDQNDRKADFSNYGRNVDMAAPGVDMVTTSTDDSYYFSARGTSFSSPAAAGVVALVKASFPAYNGIQAAEQVRVTADNIDAKNPGFEGQFGRGLINAFQALTTATPSIRLLSATFRDENGSGIIEPGEDVDIQLQMINYLAQATGVEINLLTDDPYVQIINGTITLPSIGTLATLAPDVPLTIRIADTAPTGHKLNMNVEITSAGYKDQDQFTLTVRPLHAEITVNNIAASVTNVGRIGRANNGSEPDMDGIGFSYKGSQNVLFEGALIVGTDAAHISDAARASVSDSDLTWDNDFAVTPEGHLRIIAPGLYTDQETIGIFQDTDAASPLNIRITQQSYANKMEPYSDLFLLRYLVENLNREKLESFYFGLFFDWDVDESTAQYNYAGFDAERNLGYITDNGFGPSIFAGTRILTSGQVQFRAIYNDENDADNPSWGLYDGFTDDEKWQAISGGVSFTEAGPADVSYVIGLGPFSIEPMDTLTLGFSLLAGNSLDALQEHADSAQKLWDNLFGNTSPTPPIPGKYFIEQNYPNPFNQRTTLTYGLAEDCDVDITIHNILGERVRTLVDSKQPAGNYSTSWDALDDRGNPLPSGNYLYRIKAGSFKRIKKMVLLR
jgi:serine protease